MTRKRSTKSSGIPVRGTCSTPRRSSGSPNGSDGFSRVIPIGFLPRVLNTLLRATRFRKLRVLRVSSPSCMGKWSDSSAYLQYEHC